MPGPEMKIEYGGPDKIVILPQPRMQPAKCILCGASGDGRPFIDIGCYIDWYGTVYFCGFCIVQISNKLGYYSPSQFDLVQNQLVVALAENIRLAQENDNFSSIVGTLLSLSSAERDRFVRLFNEFVQDRKDALDEHPAEGSSDLGIDEQNPKSGPDDVPSTTGSEPEQLAITFGDLHSDG